MARQRCCCMSSRVSVLLFLFPLTSQCGAVIDVLADDMYRAIGKLYICIKRFFSVCNDYSMYAFDVASSVFNGFEDVPVIINLRQERQERQGRVDTEKTVRLSQVM